MADSAEPKMSGSRDVAVAVAPAAAEGEAASSLQQPQDALELKDIDKAEGESRPQTTAAAPSIPAKDEDPVASGDSLLPAVQSTTASTDDAAIKGKEKDEAPIPPSTMRQDSLAIGPSTDRPTSLSPAPADGSVCNITLLLTTGARHPYRIDDKYLSKRNVEVAEMTDDGKKDPFSISVYKLKELILREWRDEWEAKPVSPSSIRLIYFGKLLDDKETLKKYRFSTESPNVVHMSVRPPEMTEEEDGGKSKSGGRDRATREGGSGCCVIL